MPYCMFKDDRAAMSMLQLKTKITTASEPQASIAMLNIVRRCNLLIYFSCKITHRAA